MFTITKRFEFSASHQLTHLPEGHQCARLHGHNYVVEMELRAGKLNDEWFVRDYGELAAVKQFLDGTWDHRHLNDHLADPPTAEVMARFLYYEFIGQYRELVAVRVMETPKTCAEFRVG